MKARKKFFILFAILICFLCGSFSVSAMNTGFETEELIPNKQKTLKDTIQFSLIFDEPKENTILCFDVNDNGMIAIGSQNSSSKTISVYTQDGQFKYSYLFDCAGSFGIEWDEGSLLIYLVRSDLALSIDRNGEIIEIQEIKNTIKNNDYWNNTVFATKREVLNKQYLLQNDMGFFNLFASSYAQLVEFDIDGSTKMLYDVNTAYTIKIAFIFVTVLVVFITTVVIITSQIKKSKEEYLKEKQ